MKKESTGKWLPKYFTVGMNVEWLPRKSRSREPIVPDSISEALGMDVTVVCSVRNQPIFCDAAKFAAT